MTNKKYNHDVIFRDLMIAANVGLFAAFITFRVLHLPKDVCMLLVGIIAVVVCMQLKKPWKSQNK